MEWKPVASHPKWEVSDTGVVRHRDRQEPLKPNRGCVTMGDANRSITRLMRENWTYEWIKDLREDETAKEVPYLPGYYVTTHGRVFTLQSYMWMSPGPWLETPYDQVTIGGTARLIHQLVGRTFLPDYKPGLHILHKDESRPRDTMNWLDNLWCGTQQDNAADRVNKGRQPAQVPNDTKEYFYEFMRKYEELVSYARTRPGDPDSRLNRDARLREFYMEETDALASDIGDWQHGFHSGCLATMRMVMTALYPYEVPDEESDDPNATWTFGGLEEAKEEFPMLDT